MTGMFFLRCLQLSAEGLFASVLPAAGRPESHSLQGLGAPDLLVWAGGGFTFAYLASLPILVFHATRSLDTQSSPTQKRHFPPLMASILLIIATTLLIVIKHAATDGGLWLAVAALMIVLAFSCFQGHRIWQARRQDFRAAKYARDIASARVSGGIWKAAQETSEYVTSYRHLREHGNAAFIVLQQSALFALLYTCLTVSEDTGKWGSWTPSQWTAYSISLLLLILWIVPSVAIHPFSQRLEAGLISAPPSSTWAESTGYTEPSKVLPTSSSVQKLEGSTASPATPAQRFKARLRMLKAVSQFSPWLLPLNHTGFYGGHFV